jgi:hypothetical protein
MTVRQTRLLLFAGLTAIFAGYFAVWLPGPAAGLRLIGFEMGEWIKFLGVGRSRDLFYLPPITLALLMILLTVAWPYDQWSAWTMRLIALGVSLIAFPSIEAIRFEPVGEWLFRLLLIGLVFIVAILAGLFQTKVGTMPDQQTIWKVMLALGIVGALLPTWIYLQVRPIVSQAFGLPLGLGLGLWLNLIGHLLVTGSALAQLTRRADSSFQSGSPTSREH